MRKSPLEKVVENGVRFLSEFFPDKTYLYFPLLSASLVWAMRRTREWKEKILSWKVWLDPGFIEVKTDEFILDFFKNNQALSRAYETEIKKEDMKSLRKAFSRLYPVLGLEEPFLSALFNQEIESSDYRKIVKEFEVRVSKAKKDIEGVKGKSRLLEALKTFAYEAASFSFDLISQAKLRKIIADLVKKQIEEKND